MSYRPLTGVLPVVQTPFAPNGEVDIPALRSEIAWVLDQGVNGLVTGMVSETLRLSEEERRRVAEVVCGEANKADKASIIACGAESTFHAVRFTQHAQDLGADGAMVIPPTTVTLGEEDIFNYYAAIFAKVDIPIIIQDASGYIGRPMSISLQGRLLDAFGDQALFKPEAAPIGPRLSELREATNGKARIFEGSGGGAVLDSFRRGIVGTMPGAEVCWAIQALWDACTEGDWDKAYRISGPLSLLVAMEVSVESYVSIEKYLLRKQGVLECADLRGPIGYTLDGDTIAEIDRLHELLLTAAAS